MDLRKVQGKVVDWVQLIQDRVEWRAFENMAMNLQN
jgi:hypothetical protein